MSHHIFDIEMIVLISALTVIILHRFVQISYIDKTAHGLMAALIMCFSKRSRKNVS